MRLRTLVAAVELHQTALRHPASLLQGIGVRPSLRKRGSVWGGGPSGETVTPSRSRPLELCSTEDHNHHLQDEASRSYGASLRPDNKQVKGANCAAFAMDAFPSTQ